MSEDKETQSGMSEMATQILKDPDAQKALMDLTKPLQEMQETVFQQMIDQQNNILAALQIVIDTLVQLKADIAVLSKKGGN